MNLVERRRKYRMGNFVMYNAII